MNRSLLTWSAFAAALALALSVMLWLSVKMLTFEHTEAQAEARASLEENVRLALWRMDSAATVLLMQNPGPKPAVKGGPTISLNNSKLTGNLNAGPQSSLGNISGNIVGNASKNADAQQQQLGINNAYAQRSDLKYQQEFSKQEWQQRAAFNDVNRDNGLPAANWHTLEPALLERIADILPGAKLEAVAAGPDDPEDTRRLASIPARLVVPASLMPDVELPWNTPLRVSLMIAWGAAGIAAIAVALLLRGALSLSERRGAFVSAVTHELRTPLTTFKMYADMLATGMVTDPPARQQYLDTLVSESDRLGHLIENVLAYARLERRIAPSRAETLSLAALLDRITPALRRRTDQAGMQLDIMLPDLPDNLLLRADALAVHQILLNLVDNACKYGKPPIELSATRTDGHLQIRVTDRGPGLTPQQSARLFTAFNKSATSTAPGIGLGLFLSRRLARDLGGDLQCDRSHTGGAAFVLTLPLA